MSRDREAFRERFRQYKQGKSVREIYGLPGYAGGSVPSSVEDTADFLRQYEGFRDKTYLDGKGIPTIGYGFTDTKFVDKGTITRKEADVELRRQIKERQSKLRNKLGPKIWDSLSNDSKKALTSYHFNYPAGFKENTKFMQYWRAGRYADAIKEVDAGWNDSANPGLRTRRIAEQTLLRKDPVLFQKPHTKKPTDALIQYPEEQVIDYTDRRNTVGAEIDRSIWAHNVMNDIQGMAYDVPIWESKALPALEPIDLDVTPFKTYEDGSPAVYTTNNRQYKCGKLPKLADGYVRQNDNPIKFDEQTGELVDQVTGEKGTMLLPEITVTRAKPENYRSSYDRATVDEFIRIIDPSGVTSLPQMVKSGMEFFKNPSISNGMDFGLSVLSTAPLVGKYGKIFSKIPKFNDVRRFQNLISSPIRLPIAKLAKSKDVTEISNILHLPGKNTRINTPIVLSRLATQSDPDLMYYGARHSSGEPTRAYYGNIFTGSYDYSNNRGLKTKDRYAGDASYDKRDLVKSFIYGTDLPDRLEDSLNTRRYKGYIVPTIKDTIYLDPSYKDIVDSLFSGGDIIPFSEQLLRKDGDQRFGHQILDNVKRGQLKFNKKDNQYYANLSDLWDLAGTTFFIGDMFQKRVENSGGGPFYLEQNSPIKFTTDYRNDILPTVAPRLTLLRDKYPNSNLSGYKDGKIAIKPANRGKFNATKKRTGKTTEELTHSKNPLTRKRAIFAQNAKKWNHK